MRHLRVTLNYSVTFTCAALERRTIQNFHRPAPILNDVHLLKTSGRLRNAGPVRTEHRGEKIVRDAQRSGIHAVVSHQKPARETPIDIVQAIACRCLRHMQPEQCGISFQDSLKIPSGRERRLQVTNFNSETISANLHHFAKRPMAQSGNRMHP